MLLTYEQCESIPSLVSMSIHVFYVHWRPLTIRFWSTKQGWR